MLDWIRRLLFKRTIPNDIDQARALIQAVDRGGIPLHPARVNAIARGLGLDVSTRAPVSHTIERIRNCVKRAS